MLLLILRGTPTIYYGDEIGMHHVAIAPDQVRDPFEKNVPGIGVGRDGCRTPMQWDASAGAGFSNAKPSQPLAEDYTHENVAYLDADISSILSLYKALIALRRKVPQLQSPRVRSALDVRSCCRPCSTARATRCIDSGNEGVILGRTAQE